MRVFEFQGSLNLLSQCRNVTYSLAIPKAARSTVDEPKTPLSGD
jgi:hypothetical protein